MFMLYIVVCFYGMSGCVLVVSVHVSVWLCRFGCVGFALVVWLIERVTGQSNYDIGRTHRLSLNNLDKFHQPVSQSPKPTATNDNKHNTTRHICAHGNIHNGHDSDSVL